MEIKLSTMSHLSVGTSRSAYSNGTPRTALPLITSLIIKNEVSKLYISLLEFKSIFTSFCFLQFFKINFCFLLMTLWVLGPAKTQVFAFSCRYRVHGFFTYEDFLRLRSSVSSVNYTPCNPHMKTCRLLRHHSYTEIVTR